MIGVVHAPALGDTYTAIAGSGARLNGTALLVGSESSPKTDMRVSCPTSWAKALRDAGIDFDFQPKIPSLALRIVLVASGVYTAGFAGRDSHDWDLAAADLILQEAGGVLADLDGLPLRYNKVEPKHGTLTATPRALQPSFREALARTRFG